jgi:hypothetical protein
MIGLTLILKDFNMNTCYYCEEPTENTIKSTTDDLQCVFGIVLCDDCINSYDNKTGYCSLDCCISGRCDESC